MSLNALKDLIPDYAKDIKLNLSSMTNIPAMNDQQIWGTIVSSALATRNQQLIQAVMADAASKLSAEALNAAKTAAALMAMNNIYYRFVHLVGNPEYGTMPARLRMNAMSNPGVDKKDFELWSLAVSAVNGCGMCMKSHEKILLGEGVSKDIIQDSIRIASILHAVANVLDIETATNAANMANATSVAA